MLLTIRDDGSDCCAGSGVDVEAAISDDFGFDVYLWKWLECG